MSRLDNFIQDIAAFRWSRREFLRALGYGTLGSGAAAASLVNLWSARGAPPAAMPRIEAQEDSVQKSLPERIETLPIGDSTIQVRIVGDLSSPIRYVVIHGDEETAPQAAELHLQRYGGALIQLVNPGKRLVTFRLPELRFTYDFDPNRIFTRTGLERTLRARNRRTRQSRFPRLFAAVQEFADRFLNLLVEPRVKGQGLIAVHNNGTSPNSDFSFETFVNSRGYFPGVEAMQYRRNHSPYNLFVVTDAADYDALAARGLNVVLENSELASDDGSLSVFCGRQRIRYANVEGRMGEVGKHVEMLDTLREIWNASLGA
ncbi:MAG TPA: hypothetical protein VM182_04245 [Terriglobia bacterium]|nr:hypothetical protein [Terriglobia bacterium]